MMLNTSLKVSDVPSALLKHILPEPQLQLPGFWISLLGSSHGTGVSPGKENTIENLDVQKAGEGDALNRPKGILISSCCTEGPYPVSCWPGLASHCFRARC